LPLAPGKKLPRRVISTQMRQTNYTLGVQE
jgi:hypothetical protein